MTRSFAPLLFCLSLLAGCTSGPSVRQAGDFAVAALTEEVPQTTLPELLRAFEDDDVEVYVGPIVPALVRQNIEELSYKLNHSKRKTETDIAAETKWHTLNTCFSVETTSEYGDKTDLTFFHFYLFDSDGKKHPLTPVAEQGYDRESHTVTYGGYYRGSISGTFFGRPTSIPQFTPERSFTVSTHYRWNTYCANRRVDLTKGFSIQVHARYQLGLSPHTLRWTPRSSQALAE